MDEAIHPDARFDIDWLALRAGPDARARDPALTARVREWLRERRRHRARLKLLDLGSGSGANPCFLAAQLPGPQDWTLFDHDRDLLARAAARGAGLRDEAGEGVGIDIVHRDLVRLQAGDLAGYDLVTASALIDLVDAAWLERLAAGCGEAGCALLITLSVNGMWHLEGEQEDIDANADDAFVRAAFNAHQRGTKGVGQALGPDAPSFLAAALGARGFQVALAPSPWRLRMDEADEGALARALLRGWRSAAQQQCPAAAERIDAWYRRRSGTLRKAAVVVEVGHLDLLALPPCGADGGGREHAVPPA